MDLKRATDIIGVSLSACSSCPERIEKAWNKTLLRVHLDKCAGAESKQRAQEVNEAKEVLLSFFLPRSEGDKKEAMLREQEEERKRQQEETKAKFHAWAEKQWEEGDAKMKAWRRERYARNSKERPEGARIHRKIEDYEEGQALIEEMKKFVNEHFKLAKGAKSAANIMLIRFMGTRKTTTRLKENLLCVTSSG